MGSNAGDGGQAPYDGLIYPNWTQQASASDTSGTAADNTNTTYAATWETAGQGTRSPGAGGLVRRSAGGSNAGQSAATAATAAKRVITPVMTYTSNSAGPPPPPPAQGVPGFGYFHRHTSSTGAHSGAGSTTSPSSALHHRLGERAPTLNASAGNGASHAVVFRNTPTNAADKNNGNNNNRRVTSQEWATDWRGQAAPLMSEPGRTPAGQSQAHAAAGGGGGGGEGPLSITLPSSALLPPSSSQTLQQQQMPATTTSAFYPLMEGNARATFAGGEERNNNNSPALSAPYANYPTSPPDMTPTGGGGSNYGVTNSNNYYYNNDSSNPHQAMHTAAQQPYSESTHSTTLQRALTTLLPPSVGAGTATTVPPFAPPTFIPYNSTSMSSSEGGGLPATMSAPVMPGMGQNTNNNTNNNSSGSPSTTGVPRVTFVSSPRSAAEEEAGLRRRGTTTTANNNSSSNNGGGHGARGFLSGVMHRWLSDNGGNFAARGTSAAAEGEEYDDATNSSSGRSRQEARPMHQLRFGCPEDDLPLLEELGIVPRNIAAKAFAVLNPFRRLPPAVLEDTDLAGPIVFAITLAFLLSLSGKIQFSAIYGLCVTGVVLFKLLLTLMHNRNVPAQFIMSALGYALLPNLFLAWLRLAQYWVWWLSLHRSFMPLTILVILWSSWCATTLLVKGQGMETQRYLILYPVLLFYAVFAALTIF